MPEGHTIHRLAREHAAAFAGRPLAATSPQGRFAAGAARLDGQVLLGVDAYGKHLFYRFERGDLLHVHLGLYGKWTAGPLPPPEPRGALRLRLVGDERYADLRGPTVCELLTPPEHAAILARLGPDPLARRPRPELFVERLTGSRTAVGALLMDQRTVAGVGNVYRAELLFRAGLSPHRPGRAVPPEVAGALWEDLRGLLRAGVRAGRIVTTRPEDRERRGGRVRREDAHYVYRRAGQPCRRCGTPVATEVMVGRNLFWCPTCQPG